MITSFLFLNFESDSTHRVRGAEQEMREPCGPLTKAKAQLTRAAWPVMSEPSGGRIPEGLRCADPLQSKGAGALLSLPPQPG